MGPRSGDGAAGRGWGLAVPRRSRASSPVPRSAPGGCRARGGAARRDAAGWESGQVTPGGLLPFAACSAARAAGAAVRSSALAPPPAAALNPARPRRSALLPAR
jgi:hypothetical protein